MVEEATGLVLGIMWVLVAPHGVRRDCIRQVNRRRVVDRVSDMQIAYNAACTLCPGHLQSSEQALISRELARSHADPGCQDYTSEQDAPL